MSDADNSETLVLVNLLQDDEYARKVIPFLKEEYFDAHSCAQSVFRAAREYFHKYNCLPERNDLLVTLSNDDSLEFVVKERASTLTRGLFDTAPSRNKEWLLQTTEDFCKDRAVYNAIQKSILIYDGSEKTLTTAAIPVLLKDAIGVSFDNRVGMDFFDDAAARFDYYTNPETRIPFHLETLNDATDGGITSKSLNVLISGTGGGKTMTMIDLAAGYIRRGLNVLYISLEMREESIFQRLDANLLNLTINDMATVSRDMYLSKVELLKQKSYGWMRVKEFPPGAASSANFKHVLDELKNKKNLKPDIVFVDYLTITASARMKPGQVGSYFYYKAVAEELRALAVEYDVAVWTAAQFNRTGMGASDAGMEDIAESVAILHTCDAAWGLIRSEELDQVGQILWKQLKSRYANKSNKLRFVTGVDIEKQKLYDVDSEHKPQLAQEDVRIDTKHMKNRFTGLQ